MAPHTSHDEFFSSLTDLLSKTSSQAHGSVYLTQKPLIDVPDGNTNAPNPKKASKDGKITKSASKATKIKLSTIVNPDDLEAFYARYAEVCKAGMTGLKKRDRRAKKAKTKGGAAKATKA